MDNKKPTLDKILWLDLEMTGLIPETDVIIEAAAIITNEQLEELDCYHKVVKQSKNHLEKMDKWNQKCHRQSGLYDLIPKGKDLFLVEEDLLSLVTKHFGEKDHIVILAGNCISQDRSFIRKYMPRLDKKLFYRMLDVTAWKLIFERQGFIFEKANKHRALEDTRESIREMRFYLNNVDFKKSSLSANAIEEIRKT
ncbi:MAG: oligoribonuclease [Bdellovibrionales bacterium]|nr:oligoribonuclease [Bdellovibrionales bacterium]